MIMKSIVLASLGMLIAAVPAWAVAPAVRLIQPVGGQRGTEVAVTLSGQRLADIQEILFYQPGITVTKIVGGKEPQAVATFKIAETADARPARFPRSHRHGHELLEDLQRRDAQGGGRGRAQ